MQQDAELWERWINGASLTLLAELRRRAPHAIDWTAMGMSCHCSTPSRPGLVAGRSATIESEKNFAMTNYFVGMYKSVQTPTQRSVRSEPALHHRNRHAA
jgi:hypothetical protein